MAQRNAVDSEKEYDMQMFMRMQPYKDARDELVRLSTIIDNLVTPGQAPESLALRTTQVAAAQQQLNDAFLQQAVPEEKRAIVAYAAARVWYALVRAAAVMQTVSPPTSPFQLAYDEVEFRAMARACMRYNVTEQDIVTAALAVYTHRTGHVQYAASPDTITELRIVQQVLSLPSP
jgi:hypothetical protein